MAGAIVAAVAALAGVVVGVVLSRYAGFRASGRKARAEPVVDAYTDYLFGAAALAASSPADADSPRKSERDAEGSVVAGSVRTAAAAARLAIYGSPAAIRRLAEVSRRGGVLADPDTAEAFVSAMLEMRRQFWKEDLEALSAEELAALRKDIGLLVLGTEPGRDGNGV